MGALPLRTSSLPTWTNHRQPHSRGMRTFKTLLYVSLRRPVSRANLETKRDRGLSTERAFTRATTPHCLGAHALRAVMQQNIPLLFLASKLNRPPEVVIF